MKSSRRSFIRNAAGGIAGSTLLFQNCTTNSNEDNPAISELDAILDRPVLKTQYFSGPVIIKSIQLVRYNNNYLCIVRSEDDAEGISVSNNSKMADLYPIFLNRIQPFFIGKDAVKLEQLLDEVYVYKSNYKLQGLALWVPLATLEFAVLDLLGKVAGKSMGELIGEIHNQRVSVYQANNNRGTPAGESVERIIALQAETGAKAIKFKIGGRMSHIEEPAGRTEKLIPLVRKAFGDDMTIYADSNGSYNTEEAIRIGKILEEHNIDFYEEPVPFDWYEETRTVTDSLQIPIAGGEQEPSIHNFRWLIHHNGLDIVQPDIFYFGGMIRSMKVALMAHSRGKPCIPHISGSGLGYLYMMHFVSALPNAGPYHEFKGFNKNIPLTCETSELIAENGSIKVPSGPGTGIIIDPDFIKKHKPVKV